tara:strand:+ start:31574 stop:33607 length:2034 start_codon:yes stop_codon:yes gene_type:complete
MSKFLKELQRRNVIKASLAYIVAAWVLLQVLSIVLPELETPEWVFKTIMTLLVICFPIWVLFSWVYEVTPEGLKKTHKVSTEQSITQTTNKRLNILILVGLAAAILIVLFQPNFNNSNTTISNDLEQDLSIAVLPFDDMSSTGDTQWFCDGMTEDILTHLSKISGIRVISRTSVMQYKNHKKTIPEIAKELGVSHILEGSVRKHENNVLITAQLIQANDEHLWADNFNEKLENVFKIQSDVSKKIVKQLQIKLTPEEEVSINKKATDNIEAYELYLKGRYYDGTKEGFKKSIDLLKKAISLDPNFADAYANIAYLNLIHSGAGLMNYKEGLNEAKQYIDKAFSLDPSNTEAFETSVQYYSITENYKKLKENAERAIALNPNNLDSRMLYASYFISKPIQEIDNYLKQIQIAQKIDPFSSNANSQLVRAFLMNSKVNEAEAHYNKMKFTINKGQYDFLDMMLKVAKNKDQTEILNYWKKRLEKTPDTPWLYNAVGRQYLSILNDYEKSYEYAKKAYELGQKNYSLANRYFYSVLYLKKFDEAEKLLKDPDFMKVFNGDRHKYIYFDYHYYRGEYKEALTYLEQHEKNAQYYINLGAVHGYLGNTEIVRDVTDNQETRYYVRSMLFAIQKNRDSMYFYMDKITNPFRASVVNQYPEFDPYRKEPRFKAYLKKFYFPVKD